MLGKTPRKGGKATPSPSVVGGKNIQKLKQHSQKIYARKNSKVPKSSRRFSLASDSSLSSVSPDDRNFHSLPVFDSSSDEEEKNLEMNAIMGPSSSSESDDDDSGDLTSSSEDDSDVDFVNLTKQTKAKAMKAAKSRKNPRKGVDHLKKYIKKEQKPEVKEIDFQFQFDSNGNETFKVGENLSEAENKQDQPPQEEDLGEEIPDSEFKLIDNSYDSNVLSENNLLKNHLMMDVPKIKEDEINSDEDYEIDDDKLIQTLQNDNDDLELEMGDEDYDNSEPGEELLDANEFDNLSFEGEEDIDDYDDLIENEEGDDLEEEDNYLLKEETNAITKEFSRNQEEEEDDDEDDDYLKYLSEDSILFDHNGGDGDDLNSDVDDEDDYELTFFNNPFKDPEARNTSSTRRAKSMKRKYSINNGTINEFLWPYSKKNEDDISSYDSSSFEDDEDEEDSEDENHHLEPILEQLLHSGDSTDEDTLLPKKATKKLTGSKMVAKEVLSTSETAPPLLGKWKTSENNKPFGIIDGLSTRSLQPENKFMSIATGSNGKKNRMPSFSKSTKPKLNDEPMLIDDLLNMSGLEDDDEVIPELDSTGYVLGKTIPLSLFRNKGYVPSMIDTIEQLKKYSANNKRLVKIDHVGDAKSFKDSSNGSIKKLQRRKKNREKKLQKLRRQSVAELLKEGLRSTKSGLFNENTIADVELFLADVDTGDEFSILFRGVI